MTVLDISHVNERILSEKRRDWHWIATIRPQAGIVPDLNERGELVFPPGTGIEISSKNAGSMRLEVYPDGTGQPAMERMTYDEGAGSVAVVWGYHSDGSIGLMLVREARPAANLNSEFMNCTEEIGGYRHMVFIHPPMGFATDQAMRKKLGALIIDYTQAAEKEAAEEVGAQAILKTTVPMGAAICFNPSFGKSWSGVRFIQIDLAKLETPQSDGDEIFLGTRIYSLREVKLALALGQTHDRACVSEGIGATALAKFIHYVEDFIGEAEWRRMHPMPKD